MNRLEQDAADALLAHEQRRAFIDAERARWARAQGQRITGAWTPPPLTAQQQQEFEQYRKTFNLPF